ncbi:MAG TPA: hypothetical protein VFK38_05585 [Candidatus Limnocylindrales bacterium]|nr:hypothetical protein [Candidatus Limnocylindrales bacterium]
MLPAASVGWPVSSGLLVSEVVTGGASGSDEFVELYNAGPAPLDLAGLELAYVTASGGTVTRKASWASSLLLEPGRHLLLANALGVYATAADTLYSGGLAATGGTLVLRPIGGPPIDALGWGDAVNTFVEGTPGAAPPAGSSLERRPGGAAGNGQDTNDNASDTRLEPAPVPHGLAAPAVPTPTPSGTPTPTPAATATPSATPAPTDPPTPLPTGTPAPTITPTDSPSPTPTPTATPSPSPSPTDSPSPTPTPTATPSPSPSPTDSPAPTPSTEPTDSPSATPTEPPTPTPEATASPAPSISPTPSVAPTLEPSPRPELVAIADARLLPEGSPVTVGGTLTTSLGFLDALRGAFVQDASGGIALYLATADWPAAPAGTDVIVSGTLDSRYGQATLRLSSAVDILFLGPGVPPSPQPMLTGEAGEPLEGRLVRAGGAVVGTPDPLAEGFAVDLDDGSGLLRVVVQSASGIPVEALASGTAVELTGVLGQRDSSGTGMAGYRLYPRDPADVRAIPGPTPSPSLSPTPSPVPSATPDPTPAPSPSATPAPTPTASGTPDPTPTTDPTTSIAEARRSGLDTPVVIEGVVTAEPGRLIDERTLFLQDPSGGIAVRLNGEWRQMSIERGNRLLVAGRLGQRYGNLEVRLDDAAHLEVLGHEALPAPLDVAAAALGEPLEGRLARLDVEVVSVTSSPSGSVSLLVRDASGEARVYLHASLGEDGDRFHRGQRLMASGIVGQRLAGRDRFGGFRLWPRDSSDLHIASGALASPTPSGGQPSAGSSPDGAPATRSIRDALRRVGEAVTIVGSVTATGIFDSDRRRVTLEDATGAILVRLTEGATVAVGRRVRVSGEVGTYYGAPQLEATAPAAGLGRAARQPLAVSRAPLGAGLEWRLVRVSGRVEDVRRYGATWRAELGLTGGRIVIQGVAQAGIPSTALVEGRMATVVGIVRRPYPTATDRRYLVVPRSAADIRLGGLATGATGSHATGSAGGRSTGSEGTGTGAGTGDATAAGRPLDVDLGELAAHAGELVRVGGLVSAVDATGLLLDDGSATARIAMPEDARALLAALQRGQAINVVGHVRRAVDGSYEVAPRSAADVLRLGLLDGGEASPAAPDAPLAPDTLEGARVLPDPVVLALAAMTATGAIALLAGLALTLRRRSLAAGRLRARLAAIARAPARVP